MPVAKRCNGFPANRHTLQKARYDTAGKRAGLYRGIAFPMPGSTIHHRYGKRQIVCSNRMFKFLVILFITAVSICLPRVSFKSIKTSVARILTENLSGCNQAWLYGSWPGLRLPCTDRLSLHFAPGHGSDDRENITV